MRKIRMGFIGCGGIAQSKHMPSYHALDTVELTAFCDIHVEQAQQARERFGAPGARVFDDYRELLRADVDMVAVLTPNRQHCQITCDALHAGKHVMCEKPMAITVEDAQKMVDTARATGCALTIGYQNRFRPECRYLKKMVEEGALGEIYYARAQALRRRAVPTWGVFLDAENQGGGPLIDIGTHALDLTLWLMDNYAPKLVVGSTFRKLADHENAANDWGPWDPKKFTVEDSAFGFVRMENGATIVLESSWALNTLIAEEAKSVLCGDKAGADMLGANGALRVNGEHAGKLYTLYPATDSGSPYAADGYHDPAPADLEARLWVEHLLDRKRELVVKPEQALVVTRILDAIYRSARSGDAVRL